MLLIYFFEIKHISIKENNGNERYASMDFGWVSICIKREGGSVSYASMDKNQYQPSNTSGFDGQFDIRPFDKTNDYMRDISSIHTRTLLVHREMGNAAGEIGGRKDSHK